MHREALANLILVSLFFSRGRKYQGCHYTGQSVSSGGGAEIVGTSLLSAGVLVCGSAVCKSVKIIRQINRKSQNYTLAFHQMENYLSTGLKAEELDALLFEYLKTGVCSL